MNREPFEVQIARMGPTDAAEVLQAGHLFDEAPHEDWTHRFLSERSHHLLLASVDNVPAGFVTGVEIAHPDKGVEMMLYELGVDEEFRRRGIGRELVMALLAVAEGLGCRGMWVPIDADDAVAEATYRSAGAVTKDAAAILGWEIPPPAAG